MSELSPAHVLRWALILHPPSLVGDETVANWPSFVGILPPTLVDNSIVVYNTDSTVQARLHRGPLVEKPYWQIVARSLQHDVGYGKLRAICAFFDQGIHPSSPITISIPNYGDVKIRSVSRTSGILDMGQIPSDGKKRFMLSVNGIIRYERI